MLNYDMPGYHVATRECLPPDIQKTLLESSRSEWENHPRFRGTASMLLGNHRKLLNGSSQLVTAIQQLMDVPASDITSAAACNGLIQFTDGLVAFAHHHHEIEDHVYFPQIVQVYPTLQRGLELLDGDHKVLDLALDETQNALSTLKGADVVNRDTLSGLLDGAGSLKKILDRHIWDEEEIVTPVFLRHG